MRKRAVWREKDQKLQWQEQGLPFLTETPYHALKGRWHDPEAIRPQQAVCGLAVPYILSCLGALQTVTANMTQGTLFRPKGFQGTKPQTVQMTVRIFAILNSL